MSGEQLKAFLEKVKADTSLQEKLKAAADSDAVLAIAKDAGFSISVDELKQLSEISEKELEEVAGGGTAYGYETGMAAACASPAWATVFCESLLGLCSEG